MIKLALNHEINEDIIRYMTLKVDEFCEGLSSSEDKEPVEEAE